MGKLQQQQQEEEEEEEEQALGKKTDFVLPPLWYGKAQAGLTPTSTCKREKEKRDPLLVARAGLSSYLYKPYTTCVNLSVGSGTHTTSSI